MGHLANQLSSISLLSIIYLCGAITTHKYQTMKIHSIHDLSNSYVVDMLTNNLQTVTEDDLVKNYHPDFSNNPANLFYILKDGRFKHGNYFVMEEDGKYVGSAGWNPFGDVALVLTRAFIPVTERRKYNMATYLLPKMIEESFMFPKLWITCNDYNISIYHALTRLSEGKSAGLFSSWPDIYKNFKPIGIKIVNSVPQYVAEYSR